MAGTKSKFSTTGHAIDPNGVDHPRHYNVSAAKCLGCGKGIECIDVIEHMTLNAGSAMKYLWRAGLKEGESSIKDLEKSIFGKRRLAYAGMWIRHERTGLVFFVYRSIEKNIINGIENGIFVRQRKEPSKTQKYVAWRLGVSVGVVRAAIERCGGKCEACDVPLTNDERGSSRWG